MAPRRRPPRQTAPPRPLLRDFLGSSSLSTPDGTAAPASTPDSAATPAASATQASFSSLVSSPFNDLFNAAIETLKSEPDAQLDLLDVEEKEEPADVPVVEAESLLI